MSSKGSKKNGIEIGKKLLCPLQLAQQPIRPHLHPIKTKPFLPQVLQRGADMIHRVVDAEEAVVGCRELLDGDGTVLRIVALQG